MNSLRDGCIPDRLVPSQLWAPGAGVAFSVYRLWETPRSESDLPGPVNAGPTFFLLQLPEWEGSRRSSPEGSCPPALYLSIGLAETCSFVQRPAGIAKRKGN